MKKYLLGLLLIFSGYLHAAEASLEAFFKYSELSAPSLSPTGEYIAAKVKIDGNFQLAILETKTKQIKQVFNFGDTGEVGSVGWLNDQRVYAAMHKKVGPLEQSYPNGYVFAANIDGSKKLQLLPTPRRPGKPADRPAGYRFLHLLPEDDDKVLIQLNDHLHPTVYEVDVYTGRKNKVVRSPEKYGSMYTDKKGVVRLAVAPDELYKNVTIFTRESNDAEWVEHKKVNTEKSTFNVIDFLADGNQVYVTAKPDGKEYGLYKYSFASQEMSLVLKLEGDADVRGYMYDNVYGRANLIGLLRMPGHYEKLYIDDTHPVAQLDKALSAAFPELYVDIVNFTKSGDKALVSVSGDTEPGRFFLFDLEKRKLEYLLHLKPELDRKELNQMEPFSFTARDGLEIRGYLTFPKGERKQLPLVQIVHGGPYGISDDWQYLPDAQFLANRGYLVMHVNYRGSGGRGKAFQYDAYRKMGNEMQHDLTDAVLWSVAQGYTDKSRVCMYGASYGGYASMMAAVMEPDLYKCVIPYVGVYDIELQKQADTWDSEGGRLFLDEAWNIHDKAFVQERSAIYHLDKLKSAIFLVHGEKDARVPVVHYEVLTQKLDEMKYPYKSMVKTFEGHGFRDQDNVYELWTEIEKFLNQHIGSK